MSTATSTVHSTSLVSQSAVTGSTVLLSATPGKSTTSTSLSSGNADMTLKSQSAAVGNLGGNLPASAETGKTVSVNGCIATTDAGVAGTVEPIMKPERITRQPDEMKHSIITVPSAVINLTSGHQQCSMDNIVTCSSGSKHEPVSGKEIRHEIPVALTLSSQDVLSQTTNDAKNPLNLHLFSLHSDLQPTGSNRDVKLGDVVTDVHLPAAASCQQPSLISEYVNSGCVKQAIPVQTGNTSERSCSDIGFLKFPVAANSSSLSANIVSSVPNIDSVSVSLPAKSLSATPLILTTNSTEETRDDAQKCAEDVRGSTAAVSTWGKNARDEDRLSSASLDCSSGALRRYDRHSVSSISSETTPRPSHLTAGSSDVAISHSIDKIYRPCRRERAGFDGVGGVVRSSWSQENYFDDNDVTCIDIDLDDEDLASSVDVLHYRDTSATSDSSAHSWTEDDIDNDSCIYSGKLRSWAPLSGDVFDMLSSESESDLNECESPTLPSYILHDCVKPKKLPSAFPVGIGLAVMPNSDDVTQGFSSVSESRNTDASSSVVSSRPDTAGPPTCLDEPVCVEEVLGGILASRPSTKDVDRPSAARLARRLYFLHGFRRADISRHLTKRNSFAQLVGEEFLKFFDFKGETLLVAIRRFVRHLTQNSETLDRDQLLSHFARRYHECNPHNFTSEDGCHALACAIMLLNSELHSQSTAGHKLTLSEFIANLSDMNDGKDFAQDMLTDIYDSIHASPLQFEVDDSADTSVSSAAAVSTSPQTVMTAAQIKYNAVSAATGGITNPLLQAPDSNNVAEFKKGFIMRKCCIDPDGRKTALGRRGWKMFYATLRDMTLYMYSDEHSYKRATHCSNVIHLHHALASKAGDYVKKNHVFRLQTADMAQYLIQTSDSRECQEWIDTINFVAASYSAPYQFNSVGLTNAQKRFQRPLLPSAYTTLSLRDQISYQEKMCSQFEHELLEHRKDPPEKGARSRIIQEYCKKETYLKFEIKRYKTYIKLLQYKLAAFTDLEPSLVETVIGEVEEPSTSPRHESSNTARFNFNPAPLPRHDGITDLPEDAGYGSGLDTLHET